MLGRIADSIAVLFLKKNIINEDELPVYQYGMQVLICNIAGMLTVLSLLYRSFENWRAVIQVDKKMF